MLVLLLGLAFTTCTALVLDLVISIKRSILIHNNIQSFFSPFPPLPYNFHTYFYFPLLIFCFLQAVFLTVTCKYELGL